MILAAPASGSGKTLVTLGLLRHLRNSGWRIAGAKMGPDYIDPGFHHAATGRPCINLDPWAMRPETIAALLHRSDADLLLCEGAMGLFDGGGRLGDQGSTADLAALTGWPIILIIDAGGQSASVGALLQGFTRYRDDIAVTGVIFNRVGSSRHRHMLEMAAAKAVPQLKLLGAVAKHSELTLPSRHLGLVPAQENGDLESFLEAAAALISHAVDGDRLAACAAMSTLPAPATRVALPPLGQRIALARDVAFAFSYPHLLDGWREAGAEILPFSPLQGEVPDAGADAIFLPGGYPELHAGQIAALSPFWAGLASAAGRGVAIYGECGGYMVLGQALIDRDGIAHRMAGLLPVVTSFAAPQRHLGYRRARAVNGPWRDRAFRGHEFHFARIVQGAEAGTPLFQLADADGTDLGPAGHVAGSVSGSFLHIIDAA